MLHKTLAALTSVFALSTAGAYISSTGSDSNGTFNSEKSVEITQNVRDFSLDILEKGDGQRTPAEGQNAPAYYGGMNSEEFWFCSNPLNWGKCNTAKEAAGDATSRAESLFPDSLHNGKGDAYRHCYWNARMTIDMGAAEAQGFGDRHESSSENQEEKAMDLANNATGRSVGENSNSHDAASDTCMNKANNGELETLD